MTITASDYFFGTAGQDSANDAQFFGSLKMPNGTFKMTTSARFPEIERVFGPTLRERSQHIGHALDVGVSSGVTTVEFAQFLAAVGADTRWTATDLFIDAHLVELAHGLRVLADRQGWPLQYEIGRTAIRPWIRRLDYLTLAFLPRVIARTALQGLLRSRIRKGSSRSVRLISNRLEARDDIAFLEDDITVHNPELSGRFDLIRAANVLNLNYFPKETLLNAIGNIRSYMTGPGALLLITRTGLDANNQATLFELQGNGEFAALGRVGNGSEIEDLVLQRA